MKWSTGTCSSLGVLADFASLLRWIGFFREKVSLLGTVCYHFTLDSGQDRREELWLLSLCFLCAFHSPMPENIGTSSEELFDG
jgi:hypothetical protein